MVELLTDALQVALTLVLLSGIAGVIAVATLYPAGIVRRLPRLRYVGRKDSLESLSEWCPWCVVALGALLIEVWGDTPFYFPRPEYYSVAAQVIPIVLIAVIIERTVLSSLPRRVLVHYGLLFVAGEVIAFTAISQTLNRGQYTMPHRVGGSYGLSLAMSAVTSAALITAAVLSAAAVISRGMVSDRTTDSE